MDRARLDQLIQFDFLFAIGGGLKGPVDFCVQREQ